MDRRPALPGLPVLGFIWSPRGRESALTGPSRSMFEQIGSEPICRRGLFPCGAASRDQSGRWMLPESQLMEEGQTQPSRIDLAIFPVINSHQFKSRSVKLLSLQDFGADYRLLPGCSPRSEESCRGRRAVNRDSTEPCVNPKQV